jgi:hypothetical protein
MASAAVAGTHPSRSETRPREPPQPPPTRTRHRQRAGGGGRVPPTPPRGPAPPPECAVEKGSAGPPGGRRKASHRDRQPPVEAVTLRRAEREHSQTATNTTAQPRLDNAPNAPTNSTAARGSGPSGWAPPRGGACCRATTAAGVGNKPCCVRVYPDTKTARRGTADGVFRKRHALPVPTPGAAPRDSDTAGGTRYHGAYTDSDGHFVFCRGSFVLKTMMFRDAITLFQTKHTP